MRFLLDYTSSRFPECNMSQVILLDVDTLSVKPTLSINNTGRSSTILYLSIILRPPKGGLDEAWGHSASNL